jgi:RNA polymerase sigma-70 factor (ECF subfamily)
VWLTGRPEPDDLSDESLLAGLALGEADTGAAFVRRFQRRVYGLALSVLGDAALAEDVAQEAFARAWRHAQAFDPRRGSAAAWLLAITRNLAVDALRMRRADPLAPDALLALALPAPGTEPPDAAVLADDTARLRHALRDLPGEQRRALLLAAFLGRTAEEISESEGIPLGTAKTRIRAAMLKLRAALVAEERVQ